MAKSPRKIISPERKLDLVKKVDQLTKEGVKNPVLAVASEAAEIPQNLELWYLKYKVYGESFFYKKKAMPPIATKYHELSLRIDALEKRVFSVSNTSVLRNDT